MNDFSVIYEDAAIVVLDKPTGLLAVPGLGPNKADSLATRVQAARPGTTVVHRLDRDTSGLMVMAKTATAHRHLAAQFEHRKITKRYRALVQGQPAQPVGTIDLPMRKDMTRKFRHIIDPDQGKAAVTHWQLIGRGPSQALVELEPITGRSHQLRVHLAHLGHPIVGDRLYGGPAAARLMLHATQLGLTHPTDDRPMAFESHEPFVLA